MSGRAASLAGNLRRTLARRLPLQRQVERAIDLPGLAARPRVPGSVWAVTLCRDEADIIGHTVEHLLRQGVDGVVVVDNLSRDTTRQVVRAIAVEDGRVHLGTDRLDAFHQGRKVSYLVDRVRRAGADWVVPFDADEFWFAVGGTLTDVLRSLTGPVLAVPVHDGHATRPSGIDLTDPKVEIRLDEVPSMSKIVLRPHRWAWVADGNHHSLDLAPAVPSPLRVLHLPRRTAEQAERKVLQGNRTISAAVGVPANFGHHWRAAAAAGPVERARAWQQEVSVVGGRRIGSPAQLLTWPYDEGQALSSATRSGADS